MYIYIINRANHCLRFVTSGKLSLEVVLTISRKLSFAFSSIGTRIMRRVLVKPGPAFQPDTHTTGSPGRRKPMVMPYFKQVCTLLFKSVNQLSSTLGPFFCMKANQTERKRGRERKKTTTCS